MKKENGGPAFPAASVPVELSDDLLWKWFKESLKRRGLHDFDFCVLRDVADKAAAYGREQAQQWIPVGTAHYQVAGGKPGIQWYVKPNGTIVYVKEPPTC